VEERTGRSAGVWLIATSKGIGRVPHVRLSVRGPKTMGAARQSLSEESPSNAKSAGRWNALPWLVDRPQAIVGLRPSFSAHVRWGERGAPVRFPPKFLMTLQLNQGVALFPLAQPSNLGQKVIPFRKTRGPFCGQSVVRDCARRVTSHLQQVSTNRIETMMAR
jgi:hypothetical protein